MGWQDAQSKGTRMEALIVAALLYLATQIAEKITDKTSSVIADRFGRTAGQLFGLARSRMHGDDQARHVLDQFESNPRNISHLKNIKDEINRLRSTDKVFRAELADLTEHLRDTSAEVWGELKRMAQLIEQDKLPDIPARLEQASTSPRLTPMPGLPNPPPSMEPGISRSNAGALKAELQAISAQLPEGYFTALVETLEQARYRLYDALDGTDRGGVGRPILEAIDAAIPHAVELRNVIHVLLRGIDDYNGSH